MYAVRRSAADSPLRLTRRVSSGSFTTVRTGNRFPAFHRRHTSLSASTAAPRNEPLTEPRAAEPRAATPRWQAIKNAKPFSAFLTDSFNRKHDYLRISISEKCNLRCVYCMPEEGVALQPSHTQLTAEEIIRVARLFVAQGVRKIRLTGGEPTVRKDLIDIFRGLSELPGLEEICLTTNGLVLHRKLAELQQLGLTGVNISLDTLQEGKFQVITRRNGLKNVLRSIDTAISLGIPKVKINCVVMNGVNEDEIVPFAELTKSLPVEVRFIEYMPFDGNRWSQKKLYPYDRMLTDLEGHFGAGSLIPEPLKGGETAKSFQIAGHAGKIGFITSMTDTFCGTCNRLRITSDGNLKVCLFDVSTEVSLRDMMRLGKSDESILQVIGRAVKNKKEAHADMEVLKNTPNRPMILIGNGSVERSNWPLKVSKLIGVGEFPSTAPQSIRYFSSCATQKAEDDPKLSHVSSDGSAHMVDIHSKKITHRRATAVGKISFSAPGVVELVKQNLMKKGDVLSVARVAAIMAVKNTSNLIPLCHPLKITKVSVDFSTSADDSASPYVSTKPGEQFISVETTVDCVDKSGVEIEAITGTSVALITVYDMCKAVDKSMVISEVKLVHKSGGQSGDYQLETKKAE